MTICQEMRDEIERLEPGVHRMVPLDITLKNGEKCPVQYYHLYVFHHTDAWTDESKQQRFSNVPRGPIHPGGVMKREAVEGMHIWHNRGSNFWFVSEELLAFIRKNKLAPMSSIKIHLE